MADSGVDTDSNDVELIDQDSNFIAKNPPPPPPPPTSPELSGEGAVNHIQFQGHEFLINQDGFVINTGHIPNSECTNSNESMDEPLEEETEESEPGKVEFLNGDSPPGPSPSPGFFGFLPSPPAPPATPTNPCKALMKFEFPQKLIYNFGSVGTMNLNFAQVNFTQPNLDQMSTYNPVEVSDCRSLIPYEQRELHHKDRVFVRTSRRYFIKSYRGPGDWTQMRKEYNEKRLRIAAGAGNTEMLARILAGGADPNSADELGRTGLHLAACKGYDEVVRLLLQAGANPNKKDSIGNTPLHLSACTNHFSVATLLLRAGTDVSQLDNHGRNPLQLAQSKLKLLASQSATEAMESLKIKIQHIIEMMLEYLQKKGHDEDAELLNVLASRLTLSTPEQVDEDVKNLLANLASLSVADKINASGGGVE